MRPALALLMVALQQLAYADPLPQLPPILAKGGYAGLIAPAASSAPGMGLHVRATLYGAGPPRLLGWQGGASLSLGGYAEAGLATGGALTDDTGHTFAPLEVWGRVGPFYPLSAREAGPLIAAFGEVAIGGGTFGPGHYPQAQLIGGIVGMKRQRIELTGGLAYQRGEAGELPLYHGLQAHLAGWLRVSKDAEIGAEAVMRAGCSTAEQRECPLSLVVALGGRLVDIHGASAAGGAAVAIGVGDGAQWSGLGRMGISFGPRFVPVPPAPELPPSWIEEALARRLAEIGRWWATQHGPRLDLPDRPELPALAQLPAQPARCQPSVTQGRACQVAGWRDYVPTPQQVGDAAKEGGRQVLYGVTGLACGLVGGVVPWQCYPQPQEPIYHLSKGVGEVIAGVTQGIIGTGGEVAGVGLDLLPPTAPVGVAVHAGSAVLVLNGVRAIGQGARSIGTGISLMAGGAGPVKKGQKGVAQAVTDLTATGHDVDGTEATFDTAAGRRRVDILVRDPSGNRIAVEVKTGKSRYTKGQQAKDAALATGGGVPAGENAKAAGVTGSIKIPTKVIRYP